MQIDMRMISFIFANFVSHTPINNAFHFSHNFFLICSCSNSLVFGLFIVICHFLDCVSFAILRPLFSATEVDLRHELRQLLRQLKTTLYQRLQTVAT